jgi:hypothetical protein
MESALTSFSFMVAVFAWLLFYQAGIMRRDRFRSDIRRIRNNLFDFMWENGFDFKDPAYVATRQAMNGVLRLSSTLSSVKYFVAFCIHYDDEPIEHPKSKDPRIQRELDEAMRQVVQRLLVFLFLEGTAGLIVRCTNMLLKLFRMWNRTRMWFLRGGYSIVLGATEMGAPNLTSSQRALLHH